MLLNISILSNTLFALALQIIYKHICKEHFLRKISQLLR